MKLIPLCIKTVSSSYFEKQLDDIHLVSIRIIFVYIVVAILKRLVIIHYILHLGHHVSVRKTKF